MLGIFATACSRTETATSADAAPMAVATPSAMASASATPAASAAASAAPVTAESDPLPTHSDAASKVRADISKANYKTELDKIEKEIE
jgi:hypothetical protein